MVAVATLSNQSALAGLPRTALALFTSDSARDFACDVLRAAGVLSVLPASERKNDCPHVDVIVTDWPQGEDIDSYVEGLRNSNGARRDTPILMLTNREGRADLQAARAAGVDAYVVKPVSPALLKHRLAKLAGNSRDR
jgi:CheY-like chemotaxis protein